jgi:hypothetical protein
MYCSRFLKRASHSFSCPSFHFSCCHPAPEALSGLGAISLEDDWGRSSRRCWSVIKPPRQLGNISIQGSPWPAQSIANRFDRLDAADNYAALRARRPNRFCAAKVEDAGFWPVMSRPSTTENGCQLASFSKIAPSRNSSSSTRNGTTWVSWTSASSRPLGRPYPS